jgi:glyceraldehyde-3-phosphate dehydrogenase (NAD(P))
MAQKKRFIHVIGTGTIGEPLIGLLTEVRQSLGFDEVTFHKRTPLLTDRSKVVDLIRRGARLAVDDEARQGFRSIGVEPAYAATQAIEQAAVVIDCTPSGVGHRNKQQFYEKYAHTAAGFIAQGSEFGFGKMYALGINDQALRHGEDKFVQVVSCNTHNLAVLLHAVALAGGGEENLVEGRFVCIRRANDISQDEDFIPSPKVGSHKDERFGTHHARDAYHLFRTLGMDLNLFSSALKVNSQYMHAVWFNIRVRKPTSREAVLKALAANEHVSLTHKSSANLVFSFGRDHGFFGRIFNQTVVVAPTVHVHGGTEVVGFSFTPQDGNSVISSAAAATWFIHPDDYLKRIEPLKRYFFPEV